MATADLTRINTNIAALNTLNALRDVNRSLAMHQARLSTGRRINEAADDPAGLTLATKFSVRSDSLQRAADNIGDAKNLLSVAEGGLKKINEILGKMRIKAEQAASETLGTAERNAIAADLGQYAREIDDIVEQTTWNSQKLLDGTSDFDFQTSADYDKYTNWALGQAHDVQGSGSAGLGDLATVSGTSTGVETTDTGNVLTNGQTDGGNATFSGLTELSSGVYTVKVVLGTTDGSAADSYIQLVDSNGQPVIVDANGAANGILDNKVTFAYDTASAKDIDFGNGLQVQLASGLLTGAQTDATVTYTKSGSYSVSLADAAAARTYMNTVDTAIATVSSSLSNIGAIMDRLTFKEDALAIGKVNTDAAFNRIMNADMAAEQLEAVKMQILQQTATAMLAQANSQPQAVLQLFR
ncbi:MAG: flagellin [Anaerolineae bacterium]|nr:flagellin [Anaerolineae bacterium]